MQIVKRDGAEVKFDISKIVEAISKLISEIAERVQEVAREAFTRMHEVASVIGLIAYLRLMLCFLSFCL